MLKSIFKIRVWTIKIISLQCSSTSSLIPMWWVIVITFVHNLMSTIINNFIISLFGKMDSMMSLMWILFLRLFLLSNWFIFIKEWCFHFFLHWLFLKIFNWNLLLVSALFHDLSCYNGSSSSFLLVWNFRIIQFQFIILVLSKLMMIKMTFFVFHLLKNALQSLPLLTFNLKLMFMLCHRHFSL